MLFTTDCDFVTYVKLFVILVPAWNGPISRQIFSVMVLALALFRLSFSLLTFFINFSHPPLPFSRNNKQAGKEDAIMIGYLIKMQVDEATITVLMSLPYYISYRIPSPSREFYFKLIKGRLLKAPPPLSHQTNISRQ